MEENCGGGKDLNWTAEPRLEGETAYMPFKITKQSKAVPLQAIVALEGRGT
jgi:hypothetical protein